MTKRKSDDQITPERMVRLDDGTVLPLNIDAFAELQRTKLAKENRGYGTYPQEPVRYRPSVDNLVRRTGDEVNTEFREHDEPDNQNDDPSI